MDGFDIVEQIGEGQSAKAFKVICNKIWQKKSVIFANCHLDAGFTSA